MTKAEERKKLIDDIIRMSEELEYLEFRLPDVLYELRKLKPTKKEIEEYDLNILFDTYL